jgi:hypothetical protein
MLCQKRKNIGSIKEGRKDDIEERKVSWKQKEDRRKKGKEKGFEKTDFRFFYSMEDVHLPLLPILLAFLLFQGSGNNATYQNTWQFWRQTGSTVSSGSGKRTAYDTLPLVGLQFEDAGGTFATYALNAGYTNRTLQSIVSGCISNTVNDGGTQWTAGLCVNVANAIECVGISCTDLRLGVGDGTPSGSDWGLFMLIAGNGDGDFSGSSTYSFGSEYRLNNAYTGQCTIYGIVEFTPGALLDELCPISPLYACYILYMCIYVCIYVCVCLHTYMCTNIDTHAHM